MIRNPLQSVVGRARPDLNRVSDGIAASLRHFSAAQRLSEDDDKPRRPSGRQRAAAAMEELLTIATSSGPKLTSRSPNNESTSRPPPGPQAQGPNIVSVKSGFTGFTKFDPGDRPGGSSEADSVAAAEAAVAVAFPDAEGAVPPAEEEGGEEAEEEEEEAEEEEEEEEDAAAVTGCETTKTTMTLVKQYLDQLDMGTTQSYNPGITLESLAGWGPAVATSATPFGQAQTVMRQARILGGGQAFHPQRVMHPDEARALYRDGTGLFLPSAEAKDWTEWTLKKKLSSPPSEAKTAVLEAALLGQYDGPKYADSKDTIGVVQSYVKRDGTWNAAAERRIAEKVKSLLPEQTGASKASGGAKPKA
ncbi:hypothetical protein F4779DRAFT_620725 [Xylariaceae sp. FL0662B]|nr:hypothetical protein F4779DRAFT_620725 [Xylariaceae sp. FL0662B]